MSNQDSNRIISLKEIISLDTDELNQPLEQCKNIDSIVEHYLKLSDILHLDNKSGGKKERAEQTIKIILALSGK